MITDEDFSQDNQHYHILIIICNGEITDMDQTVAAIIDASDIPLSIIIIGVGDGNVGDMEKNPTPFADMEKLDADEERLVDIEGRVQKRDIV
jgi:hypothetical protein